ncbi:type II secretion system protein N [Orrella sp. JC864]|uniref:type II secretion system protein N n=1 Tax=Orrella sp. JC864 TaxID=3120298 RepID=UPI0012BCCCA0
MRLRRLLLPLAALLVALAAALALLPARWLMAWIPAHWPVAVVDAAGSIWQGSALVAVGPPGMRRTLPEAVRWHWRWSAQGPAMRIVHPWLAGPVILAPGLAGLHVSAQSLRLPATTLAALGAPLNTLEPGGQLTAAWPALRLPGPPPEGAVLTLQWLDASSARVPIQPLGSYRARLLGREDGSLALLIDSQKGPLLVQAEGQLKRSRLVRLDGTVQPAADAAPEIREALVPILGLLGPRKNDVTTLKLP